MIDINLTFAKDGKNIRLSMTEVLIRAATSDLAKSKNPRNWTSRNTLLLPPFLTEIVVTDGDTVAEALLKIFSRKPKSRRQRTPQRSSMRKKTAGPTRTTRNKRQIQDQRKT